MNSIESEYKYGNTSAKKMLTNKLLLDTESIADYENARAIHCRRLSQAPINMKIFQHLPQFVPAMLFVWKMLLRAVEIISNRVTIAREFSELSAHARHLPKLLDVLVL